MTANDGSPTGPPAGGPAVPDDGHDVLAGRARELARVPDREQETPGVDLVAFVAGAQAYAVEAVHVARVLRGVRVTPLSGTVPCVVGMAQLDGRVAPVVDPDILLGLPAAREPAAGGLVVVVRAAGREAGVLVRSVDGVRRMGTDELQPVPAGVSARYAKGMTADGLTVLDGPRLLEAAGGDQDSPATSEDPKENG